MLVEENNGFMTMVRRMPKALAMACLVSILSCASEEISPTLASRKPVELPGEGYTLTGTVTCEGRKLAGVEVSDGVEVTLTDTFGIYRLHSSKSMGYVFVSTPSGYEPPMSGNSPQFYKRLVPMKRDQLETVDFELKSVDTDRHAIFTLADCHLAGRNNDVEQFRAVARDINASIDRLRREGYKVYGLSLGDESWDMFWYANHFDIGDAVREMQLIHAPIYHNMGNHDGNPQVEGDRASAQTFIDACGPTYYSFNLGRVHYVVLDNTNYLNDGAREGTMGRCNYRARLASQQMEWLRRDLSLITDASTPIVIAMHAPVFRHPRWDEGHEVHRELLENSGELMAALSRFTHVELLSGHLHMAHNIQVSDHITDHNVPAISATWWTTGPLAGNSVCQDGAPGGYAVYRWDGPRAEWYYKSAYHNSSYQFRAYDLNTVYLDPRSYAPERELELRAFAHGYAAPRHDNRVLINVWNYDPLWKVEAFEAGRPLAVNRVEAYDPLHIISYEGPLIQAGGVDNPHLVTTPTSHMFMARASQPNSTVRIRVTDRFGHVYTENMVRPKAFRIDMQ